jgi:hypothetical protein
MVKLKNNTKLKIAIQWKIQSIDKNIRSLSYMDIVTINDLEELKEVYLGI